MPAEQQAEQPREVRLRLERDDPAAEGGEGAGAVAGVGPHVEDEVAGAGEGRVEPPQPALAQGNRVIDGQGPDQAVEAARGRRLHGPAFCGGPDPVTMPVRCR